MENRDPRRDDAESTVTEADVDRPEDRAATSAAADDAAAAAEHEDVARGDALVETEAGLDAVTLPPPPTDG